MHIIYNFNMWAILCDFNASFIADFGHFQFLGVTHEQNHVGSLKLRPYTLGVVIMRIIYKFNMWAILCDFNANFIADFGHFQFWGVSEAQHNGPEGGN